MIKVFLVEDEVVMRNGIKKNIPWESEGFAFVGEASDGELAYPLIKREKPDILITDIKMPFMDGLELSRIVKKEMPQIKIILLSGYNEFEYAKEAISIGVTDYLLKPISSEKLLEAVKKVGKQIEQEQEQSRMLELYQKEMKENVELQKHNLWISLVSNQLSVAELLEAGNKIGIDFMSTNYMVVLFKLIQEQTPGEQYQEMLHLSEEINQLAEQWEQVLTFDRSPDGWAFLVKGNSEEIVREHLKNLRSELRQLLNTHEKIEYFGGIGTIVQRLRDVRSSYQSAAKAFASRFFLEKNQLIENTERIQLQETQTEMIDITKMFSQQAQRELLERFLKSGTMEEVDSFVEEYIRSFGQHNYQSLIYRQYIVMDLYFTISDFLTQHDMSLENLDQEYRDINGVVRDASTRENLISTIAGLLKQVMQIRDHRSQKKYSALLEDAKRFIQENYQSDEMSLNMVAAQINISPSYFSTIFSGETGQTFVEYLTAVRMEKAKELLMCTTMRTAEIGYEVGYKDSHYFSYLFKKIVGCSPKEFKNRRKEQES